MKIANRVRRIDQIAAWLRVNVRVANVHVSVACVQRALDENGDGVAGLCSWPVSGLCDITISWKNETLSSMIDTLLHEWAHALEGGDDDPDGEGHTKRWGVVYASLYRAVIDEGGLRASREFPI